MDDKDFKRLTQCLQITVTAGDGETLAAIYQANRILERNGLRWDEWLPGMKVKGNSKSRSDFSGGGFTAEDYAEQNRKWRTKRDRAEASEEDVSNPKWTLSREDAAWVKDVCERALKSDAIQGNAKRFVGDMLAGVKLFPDRVIISQKQWDWLQSIDMTLQRSRERAG